MKQVYTNLFKKKDRNKEILDQKVASCTEDILRLMNLQYPKISNEALSEYQSLTREAYNDEPLYYVEIETANGRTFNTSLFDHTVKVHKRLLTRHDMLFHLKSEGMQELDYDIMYLALEDSRLKSKFYSLETVVTLSLEKAKNLAYGRQDVVIDDITINKDFIVTRKIVKATL